MSSSSDEVQDEDEPPRKKSYKDFCNPKLKAAINPRTLHRQTQPKTVSRDEHSSDGSVASASSHQQEHNSSQESILERQESTELVHDDDGQSRDFNEISSPTNLSNDCEYQEDCHQSDDESCQNSSPADGTSCSTQSSPGREETSEEESAQEQFSPSLHSNSSDVEQICEGVSVDNLPSDSESDNGGSDDINSDHGDDGGAPFLMPNVLEELSQNIESNFCISKGELILMALSAHQQNRWTNKTLVDVLNLFNFSLQEPIVPGTQHLVDKLLFNEESAGIKKHYFCYNCGKDFGQLQNVDEILCKNKDCKRLNQANNPKKWRYFVTFDILPQLQGKLNKSGMFEKLINPRDRIHQHDNIIRDVYDGEKYTKFVTDFCVSNEIRYLSFTFNTDGIALYSSSNGSIWPIFLMVNELPPILRMQNLIIAGLWFGKDHPIMDLFLRPSVEQFNKLSNVFHLNIHGNILDFQAFVIAACVDSGARGSVQGISSHSGYFSCNWCLIPGIYYDDKIIFPIITPTPQLRNHDELQLDSVKALTTRIPTSLSALEKAEITNGAKSWCVFFGLESKSFNCVDGFVVDALHALDHGLARQCMKIWSDAESDHNYITAAKELILDTYVDMLKPPVEIRKFPRKVSDRANWTGREYYNWILIFSIPMLKDILPQPQFQSWTWFVQAIHFLSRKELTSANLDIAEKLLVEFIQKFQDDFGFTSMSFNAHIALHVCQTVRNWGPLWAISSAYAFEAGNGDVKKLLHSSNGVPNQVCRNLSHVICRSLLEQHFSSNQTKSYDVSIMPKKPMKKCVSVGTTHFLKTPLPFNPIPEENYLCEQYNVVASDCMIYSKVIKDNMLIRSSCSRRSNNCIFVTTDNKIVRFSKLIYDSKQRLGFGFCHELHCSSILKTPHSVPTLAPKDECTRKVSRNGDELILVPLTDVKMVCCLTDLPHGSYVTVLPNLFNIN